MIQCPNVAIIFKPISFSLCFLYMKLELAKFAHFDKL